MNDVLGYDCDGKPLYVGDRVVVVGAQKIQPGIEEFIDGACHIVRPYTTDGFVVLDRCGPSGDHLKARCSILRKISDDSKDKSTWDETEKATGWKPVRECA